MNHDARGFSLLEVLVATTIVAAGLSSLAQLLLIAARANAEARSSTIAFVLAQQKLEQLRIEPELAPSPAVDYADATGRLVIGAAEPPDGAVFARRWSIEPLPADPDRAFVIQVRVTRPFARGEARLAIVRARAAP